VTEIRGPRKRAGGEHEIGAESAALQLVRTGRSDHHGPECRYAAKPACRAKNARRRREKGTRCVHAGRRDQPRGDTGRDPLQGACIVEKTVGRKKMEPIPKRNTLSKREEQSPEAS